MKTIFKIIFMEIKFLISSIILIGVILILFSGAFLSVLSVRIDVPRGMYTDIDRDVPEMSCLIHNVTLGQIKEQADLAYGGVSGITYAVTLVGNKNKTHQILPTESSKYTFFSNRTRGIIVGENTDFSLFENIPDCLNGKTPKTIGEVLISKNLASMLALSLNDKLKIADNEFTIVGIYDANKYVYEFEKLALPKLSYYLVMSDDTLLDDGYLAFDKALDLKNCMRMLEKNGYKTTVLDVIDMRFNNITLAESFFMSIAFVLAIVTFFVQYALIATFFRQRKSQI